jgi:hypothetical protein
VDCGITSVIEAVSCFFVQPIKVADNAIDAKTDDAEPIVRKERFEILLIADAPENCVKSK